MALKNLKTKEILELEIDRLKKVNEVLMDRVEKVKGFGSGSFSLFETNVILATLVKERTIELEKLAEVVEGEKDKLFTIIQTLPGAVVFFDEDYQIDRSFNSFLKGNLQIREGVALHEAIGEEFFKKVSETLTKVHQDQEVAFFDFLSVSDNQEYYYTCSVSTRNKGQYVLYIQDNTIKFLQDRVIKNQEAQILQSSKLASLGEMAAGIAHEINNPLTIINLSASSLKRLLEKEEINNSLVFQTLSTMESTVMRISKIINGMKTISRESKEFHKDEVTLREVIDDVLGLCSEKFKFDGVELRMCIPPHCMDELLFCDRLQFSQVLLNLIGNAYDAAISSVERWIEVGFENGTSHHMISIKDSGKGMSQDILPKIFNPFFTMKEVGKGTGLGLSISKSIMDKHEGSIKVEMKEGYTCFLVTIPKKSGPC